MFDDRKFQGQQFPGKAIKQASSESEYMTMYEAFREAILEAYLRNLYRTAVERDQCLLYEEKLDEILNRGLFKKQVTYIRSTEDSLRNVA